MIRHADLSNEAVRALIKTRTVTLAGYAPRKIYGRLNCSSGKRISRRNRVFFCDEAEALAEGYRPCANCMALAYKVWKQACNETYAPKTNRATCPMIV